MSNGGAEGPVPPGSPEFPPPSPPPFLLPPLSITRSVLRDDARTTAAQKTMEETD